MNLRLKGFRGVGPEKGEGYRYRYQCHKVATNMKVSLEEEEKEEKALASLLTQRGSLRSFVHHHFFHLYSSL